MRLIIAGGGTGGHVYPGIAIAQEFMKRNAKNELLFIGSTKGMEGALVPKSGFRLKTVRIMKMKGTSILNRILAVMVLVRALIESLLIILRFRPHVIIGVGGYSSAPAVIGGWLIRIPRMVAEQNIIPGWTNRMLSRMVNHIFVSHEASLDYFKPQHKVIVSGNPLRAEFLNIAKVSDQFVMDRVRIVVTGGSQGAKPVNHAFIESLSLLVDLKSKFTIVHQTGTLDYEYCKEAYQRLPFEVEVQPYFERFWEVLRTATVIVSRSGSNIWEFLALRKPCILIPYPYAADNHQEANARIFEKMGCAKMVLEPTLTPERLAFLIRGFVEDRSTLQQFYRNFSDLPPLNGAEIIVNTIYQYQPIGQSI